MVNPYDQYKMATDYILSEATKRLEIQNRVQEIPQEKPIHQIRSEDIMNNQITPFSQEGDLPPFDHGSPGLPYFQTLRQYLSKLTRAKLQAAHLRESIERHQVPRGMKINKKLMAVEPTPSVKLAHYKILAKAETDIMKLTIAHLEKVIPDLEQQFTQYFDEMTSLSPADRRLVVLKLIHYKNELTMEKERSNFNKMTRPDNRQFGTYNLDTIQEPQEQPGTSRNLQNPQIPGQRQEEPPMNPQQFQPPPWGQSQQRSWTSTYNNNPWTTQEQAPPKPQRSFSRGGGRGKRGGGRGPRSRGGYE